MSGCFSWRSLVPASWLHRGRGGRHQLDFDVQVGLKAGQTPPLELTSRGGYCLGWNTWLQTRPSGTDFDEVVLTLRES